MSFETCVPCSTRHELLKSDARKRSAKFDAFSQGCRESEKNWTALKQRKDVHCYFIKGTAWQFAHLDKFSLKFSSSSFVIRVSLLHPWPSLFLYGLLLSLWCFSILVNYYFQFSFNLKGFCTWPKLLKIPWLRWWISKTQTNKRK